MRRTWGLGGGLTAALRSQFQVAVAFHRQQAITFHARHGLAHGGATLPQAIRDADLDGLRELGLDDHQILEGISIAAFIGATNRIGIALSVPPNPEYTGIPSWPTHR